MTELANLAAFTAGRTCSGPIALPDGRIGLIFGTDVLAVRSEAVALNPSSASAYVRERKRELADAAAELGALGNTAARPRATVRDEADTMRADRERERLAKLASLQVRVIDDTVDRLDAIRQSFDLEVEL